MFEKMIAKMWQEFCMTECHSWAWRFTLFRDFNSYSSDFLDKEGKHGGVCAIYHVFVSMWGWERKIEKVLYIKSIMTGHGYQITLAGQCLPSIHPERLLSSQYGQYGLKLPSVPKISLKLLWFQTYLIFKGFWSILNCCVFQFLKHLATWNASGNIWRYNVLNLNPASRNHCNMSMAPWNLHPSLTTVALQ